MTDRKPLQLRLPEDLKAWLAAEAARNGASQNSEVIRAIRERMDRQTAPAIRGSTKEQALATFIAPDGEGRGGKMRTT